MQGLKIIELDLEADMVYASVPKVESDLHNQGRYLANDRSNLLSCLEIEPLLPPPHESCF